MAYLYCCRHLVVIVLLALSIFLLVADALRLKPYHCHSDDVRRTQEVTSPSNAGVVPQQCSRAKGTASMLRHRACFHVVVASCRDGPCLKSGLTAHTKPARLANIAFDTPETGGEKEAEYYAKDLLVEQLARIARRSLLPPEVRKYLHQSANGAIWSEKLPGTADFARLGTERLEDGRTLVEGLCSGDDDDWIAGNGVPSEISLDPLGRNG